MNKTYWQWGGFAFISVFVLMAYGPSLNHLIRADSIYYFRQTAHQGFYNLVISDYDINRWPSQIDFANERGLFRPLLYACLGLEKYFFAGRFYAWHLTGIAMHLLVVFWFLRICLEFHTGLPAVGWSFLFALFFPQMEFVIWENITPYLLGIFLLLVALDRTFKVVNGSNDSGHIGLIFLCLCIGVFLYEPFNAYALIIFGFLCSARPDKWKKFFILLVPDALYAAWSLFNYFYINHLSLAQSVPGGHGFFLWNAFQMVGWWFYAGLFFCLYPLQLFALRRDQFDPSDILTYKHIPMDVCTMLPIFFIVCFFVLLAANQSSWWAARRKFVSLIAFLGFLHICLIAFFRVGQWGLRGILLGNIYYQYLFWLFIFLLMFISIDWLRIDRYPTLSLVKKALMLCVFLWGSLSGYRLYTCNQKIGKISKCCGLNF